MTAALIGDTGFVGRSLAAQTHAFERKFDTGNLPEIAGGKFELVVCAIDPGDPESLRRITGPLESVSAQRFVLLSSIEVYPRPEMVDEDGPVNLGPRSALETFCRDRFAATVLRLPTAFGPGLEHSALADLMSGGHVYDHHPEGVHQYYPLAHLWRDLHIALEKRIPVLNLACAPLPTRELAAAVFDRELSAVPAEGAPTIQDVRSKYAELWGGAPFGYLYSKERILVELKEFVERERAY